MAFNIIKSMLSHDSRLVQKPIQGRQTLDTPQTNTRTPLDIPEILERIFSYLSSSHLRVGPNLVCKQWCTLSTRYITNSLLWDSLHTNKSEIIRKEFTDRLKSTEVLKCHFRDNSYGGLGNGVELLTICIKSLSTGECSRLRKLIIVDDNLLNIVFDNSMFIAFTSLVRLKISTNSIFSITFEQFILSFPNLQELDIAIPDDKVTEGSITFGKSNQPWPETTKNLQSLAFQNMLVDIGHLQEILLYFPNLKELRLVIIQPRNFKQIDNTYEIISSVPQEQHLPSTFDYDYHFSIISKTCQNLQFFHYSERFSPPRNDSYIISLWKNFPSLHSMSLIVSYLRSAPDPSAFLSPSLAASFLDCLTTLELLSPKGMATSQETLSIGFYHLLCSTPNLLHIRATDVNFSTAVIDAKISNRGNASNYGMWACRNLKTFQIRIKPMDGELSGTVELDRGNRASRVFFAFLVKCCPHLRDIQLEYSDLRLELESGFCLFGELEYLEKLHIKTTSDHNLRQRDLDWITTRDPRKHSTRERLLHWSMVNGLKESKDDKKVSVRYTNRRPGLVKERVGGVNQEEMLKIEIQKASQLNGVSEVLERIRDRQMQGEYCWPSLESFRLYTSNPKHMSLVKSLRPQLIHQDKYVWR